MVKRMAFQHLAFNKKLERLKQVTAITINDLFEYQFFVFLKLQILRQIYLIIFFQVDID